MRVPRLVIWLAVALTVLVADALRAPEDQVTARIAVMAINGYQATVSPWMGAFGVGCRFDPTCSHYGEEVIQRHGIARGGYLALRRWVRCGPWTATGTVDPPPEKSPES